MDRPTLPGVRCKLRSAGICDGGCRWRGTSGWNLWGASPRPKKGKPEPSWPSRARAIAAVGCPVRSIRPREWVAVDLYLSHKQGLGWPAGGFHSLPRWAKGAVRALLAEHAETDRKRAEWIERQRQAKGGG